MRKRKFQTLAQALEEEEARNPEARAAAKKLEHMAAIASARDAVVEASEAWSAALLVMGAAALVGPEARRWKDACAALAALKGKK